MADLFVCRISPQDASALGITETTVFTLADERYSAYVISFTGYSLFLFPLEGTEKKVAFSYAGPDGTATAMLSLSDFQKGKYDYGITFKVPAGTLGFDVIMNSPGNTAFFAARNPSGTYNILFPWASINLNGRQGSVNMLSSLPNYGISGFNIFSTDITVGSISTQTVGLVWDVSGNFFALQSSPPPSPLPTGRKESGFASAGLLILLLGFAALIFFSLRRR